MDRNLTVLMNCDNLVEPPATMNSPLGSTEHVLSYHAVGRSPTFTHLLVSGW